MHELGHTFGLGRCADPGCVVWFSNTLGDRPQGGRLLPAGRGDATRGRLAGSMSAFGDGSNGRGGPTIAYTPDAFFSIPSMRITPSTWHPVEEAKQT
jgi:hypothetical protein